MNKNPIYWTKCDDELFRELVEAGVAPETVAAVLNRTAEDLKQRGYALGLPLKWFKPRRV